MYATNFEMAHERFPEHYLCFLLLCYSRNQVNYAVCKWSRYAKALVMLLSFTQRRWVTPEKHLFLANRHFLSVIKGLSCRFVTVDKRVVYLNFVGFFAVCAAIITVGDAVCCRCVPPAVWMKIVPAVGHWGQWNQASVGCPRRGTRRCWSGEARRGWIRSRRFL